MTPSRRVLVPRDLPPATFSSAAGDPSMTETSLPLTGNSFFILNASQHTGRIPGDDGVGRNVLGDHAAGANNRVFPDDDFREDRRPGSDRRAALHQCVFDLPITLGLQLPALGCRAGITVIDERHTVPDEHAVF